MDDINSRLYKKVQAHLSESARVKRLVAGLDVDLGIGGPAVVLSADMVHRPAASDLIAPIVGAAKVIAETFRNGGKLLLCGNGGSAADCQHMAAEFVGRLRKTDDPRRALPAIALTTDTSFLTAFANDVSFKEVFARQIEAVGRPGDILIAISTSGMSANILRAAEAARAGGLKTITLTGNTGDLADIADIAIAVPSNNVSHIQEAHLAIEHIVCGLVEDMLFRNGGRGKVESGAI